MKTILLSLFIGFPFFAFAQFIPYDTDFGESNGYTLTNLNATYATARSMALQSDNKIITGGEKNINNNWDVSLSRFHSNGLIDNSFGINGTVSMDFANKDYLADLKILDNDAIIVTGYSDYSNGHYPHFKSFIIKYHADGTLDNTFGINGKQIFNTSGFTAEQVLVQSDGKILIVGNTYMISPTLDIVIFRLNTDGSFDTNYGDNGFLLLDLGSSEMSFVSGLQQNDDLVMSYFKPVSPFTNHLIRLNNQGTIDSTFGDNGIINHNDSSLIYGYVKNLFITNNDKIITVFNAYNTILREESSFGVLQYHSDGTLDNTFGNNGFVHTQFDIKSSPLSIAQNTDGSIIIAGLTEPIMELAFAKYNPDGTPDENFGINGKFQHKIGTESDDYLSKILIIDNQILACGNSDNKKLFLAKYRNTFNQNSQQTISNINYSVYPNPTTDFLRLEYTVLKAENISIRLFDMAGRLIDTYTNVEQEIGLYEKILDLSSLSNGNYIIHIQTKEEQISIPILKN